MDYLDPFALAPNDGAGCMFLLWTGFFLYAEVQQWKIADEESLGNLE